MSGRSKKAIYRRLSDLISMKKQARKFKIALWVMTTSTGITIENFATHFVDRVIGQTSTPHSGKRCGVSVDSVLDTLQNPRKIGAVRVSADGDVRQTLFGDKAVVTMSIRDKRLIQTNRKGGQCHVKNVKGIKKFS